MFQYINNVNSYVEENSRYHADKVKLSLDEDKKIVSVYPCDANGGELKNASSIVYQQFNTLSQAIDYYNKIENQLAQGDIIRNI